MNKCSHLTLGTGAFLCTVGMMRYLEFGPKLRAFALTVKLAMGRVALMLCSIAPILIAYVLFGVIVFSRFSSRFASFDECFVSLFALLNGDDIHDSFNDLEVYTIL